MDELSTAIALLSATVPKSSSHALTTVCTQLDRLLKIEEVAREMYDAGPPTTSREGDWAKLGRVLGVTE
jgi:hypothetical protein